MAPSTPPPPSRLLLAALTMASTFSFVMSPCRTLKRSIPAQVSAVLMGGPSGWRSLLLQRHLRLLRRAADGGVVAFGQGIDQRREFAELHLRPLAMQLRQRLQRVVQRQHDQRLVGPVGRPL